MVEDVLSMPNAVSRSMLLLLNNESTPVIFLSFCEATEK